MEKKVVIVIGLIASLLVSYSFQQEYRILFQENEKDWTIEGDADWRFEKNELIGSLDEGAGFVMTKTAYDDFVLTLEFHPDSTINSGVFIRCKNRELSFEDCYEINIWDLHPRQEYRTGAVVSRMSPLKKLETINAWNTYKIKNQQDHLQAWINGILVIDLRDQDLKSGPIALQAAESGEIRFRNVKIKSL